MKKRVMSAVLASILIISMCVPASAKQVFVKTSPNGGGYWTTVPDDNNSSSSSDSGSSKASAPAASTGSSAGKDAVLTTPNGQSITDSLASALADSSEGDSAVAPVSKNTLIAVSNYLKALGSNATLVASFVPTSGKAGKTTIKNARIVKGMEYTVVVQLLNGEVILVKATGVANGSLVYNRPAGAIASVTVVAGAVAPR